MLPLTRYFVATGSGLLAAGVVTAVYGGHRIYMFLQTPPSATPPSTAQFARIVVIPHIFLALGIGLLVFGIILTCKGILFHRKHPG